jgi:bacillithiol system protein YtxJ
MALSRLENNFDSPIENIDYYFLDLLSYREISNAIAEHFNIEHQSPQLLIIKEGNCIYSRSHNGINPYELTDFLKNNNN